MRPSSRFVFTTTATVFALVFGVFWAFKDHRKVPAIQQDGSFVQVGPGVGKPAVGVTPPQANSPSSSLSSSQPPTSTAQLPRLASDIPRVAPDPTKPAPQVTPVPTSILPASGPSSPSSFTPAQRVNRLRTDWQEFNKQTSRTSRLEWERQALEWTRRHSSELGELNKHYRTSFTLPHPREANSGVLTPGSVPSTTMPDPALRGFLLGRDQLEAERTKALDDAGPVGSSARAEAAKAFEAQNAERLKKHRLEAIRLQQAPVEQLPAWRALAETRQKLLSGETGSPASAQVQPEGVRPSGVGGMPALARPTALVIPSQPLSSPSSKPLSNP